jgi:acyl-CoA synthetase (NDP forming)
MTAEIRPDRLAPLLAPRSIAFIGASDRVNTPGNSMLRMIRRGGFDGRVHAVNPKYREVEGFACHPSLADLPDRPDLAVLSIKNELLEATLCAAADAGARAAVVFASAILESDRDPRLIERLRRIAEERNIVVCGPNCMGFYNDLDRTWICGFPSPRTPDAGSIAFVAHSGSVFGALAHNDPRLRFALAISPGSELTATVADYVAYAVERPEVRVVGLFLETARDPAGFAQALSLAARRGVPVVVLKVGRTEAAAAAALTHTGALAGSDLAYQALFERYGVIRVETLDELSATLLLLSSGRRAAKGGLVAIGDSGGERELMIDLADRVGVTFAELTEPTKAAISARLDPGLEAVNPLDAWGTGADFEKQYEAFFGDLVADANAAIGLMAIDVRDGSYLHRGFANAILAASARTDKPVAVATHYTQVRHDALASELTKAGVPVLDGTTNALVAVRGALAYRDFLARRDDPLPAPPAAPRPLPGAGGPLDEAASLALLAEWNIPTIAHRIVGSAAQAREAARTLGFPCVCKTAEPGILHKSDVRGVLLGLKDGDAVAAAYEDLATRLGPRVLLAPMAPRGVELALGMIDDPQFGPLVTVGAGGTLVELLSDRQVALAPFGRTTACRLIDRLALRPLLDGYRGALATDLERLSAVISSFSVLAARFADRLAEIDVNPLLVGPQIVALDALVVLKPEPS